MCIRDSVGAGLLHGDAGLEAGKGALTEVAELDFGSVPLEGLSLIHI